jgi:hypothetical protein
MIGHHTHYGPNGSSERIWGKLICPHRNYRGKSAFKLNRIGGPAYERSDGSKEWWLNDSLQKWQDGSKHWDDLEDMNIPGYLENFPGYSDEKRARA